MPLFYTEFIPKLANIDFAIKKGCLIMKQYPSIYLSINLSICLSIYLSTYLSICLSVYLSIYLFIWPIWCRWRCWCCGCWSRGGSGRSGWRLEVSLSRTAFKRRLFVAFPCSPTILFLILYRTQVVPLRQLPLVQCTLGNSLNYLPPVQH